MSAFFGFLGILTILALIVVYSGVRWIAVIFSLLLADLFISTVYYNYVDSTMTGLETSFDNGDWHMMSCTDAYRSNTGMEPGICTGGLIDARDDYMSHKRVIALGSWWSDGWTFAPSTFRIYFTWGP